MPMMTIKVLAGKSLGQTKVLDEALARAYIEEGTAEEVKEDVSPEKAMFASVVSELKGVIEEMNEQSLQKLLAATAVDLKGKRPRILLVEDEADKTKSFADQLKHIVLAGCPVMFPGQQKEAYERLDKVYDSRLQTWQTKDLAEASGTSGGYTVAPQYAAELLRLSAEESIVRPYANVKSIPGREAFYPMLNQTTAPIAGNTAYYGGVVMTWTGEAAPRPPTEPNFKQVHLVTHELSSLTKISRTLLADSMLSMEAELKALFAGAIAWYEDYSFLQGNGVAKPLGVLAAGNASLLVATPRASSNQFKLADAAKMMARMMPQSRAKSVWILTNTLFEFLVQLVDANGRVTYIPNVGTGYNDAKLAMGQLLLFGRPVLFTEKLATEGTQGDVLLADFSKYIIADSGTLEIAASDQYAFNTNQITFRVIKRVDGKSQIDGVFVQADGTTQISPFITLAT